MWISNTGGQIVINRMNFFCFYLLGSFENPVVEKKWFRTYLLKAQMVFLMRTSLRHVLPVESLMNENSNFAWSFSHSWSYHISGLSTPDLHPTCWWFLLDESSELWEFGVVWPSSTDVYETLLNGSLRRDLKVWSFTWSDSWSGGDVKSWCHNMFRSLISGMSFLRVLSWKFSENHLSAGFVVYR